MIRSLLLSLLVACSVPSESTLTIASDRPDAGLVPDVSLDATPDDSGDLAAVMGQSNALGGTSGANTLDSVTYPRDMAYIAHITGAALPTVWTSYPVAGLGPRQARDGTTHVGPEIDLGRALEARQPGQWSMVKISVSSSSLEHWRPEGSLWPQVLERMADAEADTGAKLRFIFWLQGESDASSEPHARRYAERMIVMRDLWRERFPGLVILIARLNDDFAGTYGAIVRAQQEQLATLEGFGLIDMDDVSMHSDRVHYPVSSHLTLGERVTDRYFAN